MFIEKKCQLDDDKLKNVSVDLKKLSDVVEKEVVKKLYLTNQFRKFMQFRLSILAI